MNHRITQGHFSGRPPWLIQSLANHPNPNFPNFRLCNPKAWSQQKLRKQALSPGILSPKLCQACWGDVTSDLYTTFNARTYLRRRHAWLGMYRLAVLAVFNARTCWLRHASIEMRRVSARGDICVSQAWIGFFSKQDRQRKLGSCSEELTDSLREGS